MLRIRMLDPRIMSRSLSLWPLLLVASLLLGLLFALLDGIGMPDVWIMLAMVAGAGVVVTLAVRWQDRRHKTRSRMRIERRISDADLVVQVYDPVLVEKTIIRIQGARTKDFEALQKLNNEDLLHLVKLLKSAAVKRRETEESKQLRIHPVPIKPMLEPKLWEYVVGVTESIEVAASTVRDAFRGMHHPAPR